jgi:hypothetical protein
MADLKAERDETQQAREENQSRVADVTIGSSSHGQAVKKTVVLTAAQEMKKRKLDERKAMIEAKRMKVRYSGSSARRTNCICPDVRWQRGYREETAGDTGSGSGETDEGGRDKSGV